MVRVSTITVAPQKGAGADKAKAGGKDAGPRPSGPREVRIDLNERCYLFPAGKGVSHLVIAPASGLAGEAGADPSGWIGLAGGGATEQGDGPGPGPGPGGIDLRAIFAFNQSKSDSTIDSFTLDEARDLARTIIEGVYQARTQSVFLDGRRMGLVCNTNGFVLSGHDGAYDLFVSGQLIITVANALLRVVDSIAPIEAH